MTIIAAWYDIGNRRAAIGADSLSFDGPVKFTCCEKVRRIGPAAIGMCGSVAWDRFLDEAIAGCGDRDGRVLACWLADEWRRWAKDRGHGQDADGMRLLPAGLLLATTEGIYGLTSDGAVVRHERYAAIGAGQAVAYGALWACAVAQEGREALEPRVPVEMAVGAAIEHADGCGGEPLILTVPGEQP